MEDWLKCKEDAEQCIKLRRDYVKGWLLLAGASDLSVDFLFLDVWIRDDQIADVLRQVKSIWELGKHADALQELQNGSLS